jgi:hypothetical protein
LKQTKYQYDLLWPIYNYSVGVDSFDCIERNWFECGSLYNYSLDLIDRNLVVGAVVEIGRLRAFVVSDLLGVLDGAADFEIGGNSGRPEGMVAEFLGKGAGWTQSPTMKPSIRALCARVVMA